MPAADLARRYLHALGGEDPEAVVALVATDFENEHLAELGAGCVGREEYRRRLQGFFADLVGRHYRIDDLVTETRDDRTEVVIRYLLTATSEGTRIEIPGVMWISVAGGLIAKRIDCWDSLTFLRQTGADGDR